MLVWNWIKRYRREISFFIYGLIFFALAKFRLSEKNPDPSSVFLAYMDMFMGTVFVLNVLIASIWRLVKK